MGRKTDGCLVENMNFSDRKISLWQNRGKLPLQGIEMKSTTLIKSQRVDTPNRKHPVSRVVQLGLKGYG